MRYEYEIRGLIVENRPGYDWGVWHAGSDLAAVTGLRQRRFAEQARADLLATGVDFTADVRSVRASRRQWQDVYYTWQARVKQKAFDDATFEYYPARVGYGTFVPSARWAAAMREAVAAHDMVTFENLLSSAR